MKNFNVVRFIFITLLLSYSGFAQLKAKRIFIGGDFGIGNIKFGGKSANLPNPAYSMKVKVSPYVGIMLSNRVGLELNFGYSNIPYFYNQPSYYDLIAEAKSYWSGVTVPIYIPISKEFYFYYSPGFSVIKVVKKKDVFFQSRKISFDNNGNPILKSDVSEIYINAGISLGFLYFPHKRIGLNFTLGRFFNFIQSTSNNDGRFDIINFSTNGPTLGINFWFGKIE